MTVLTTLAALADPTRLRIVRLLGQQPLQPSAIAEALDASRPVTSRHLRVLRRAGLVQDEVQRDDARVRLYRLRREPFDDLRGLVEEVESFWDDQLAAFVDHAEAKRDGPRTSR